jgi:group I intron endonuclease
MKNIYCIYRHTSPIGKSYIGQTMRYKRRCKEHQEKTFGAFSCAIKKYGWDSFAHEILIDGLTIDEANELERFFISWLGTVSPQGYNLTTGGYGATFTEEVRIKMSESGKTRKPITQATRSKMSASRMGNKYSKGFIHTAETLAKRAAARTGKVHSDETKRKISDAAKGRVTSDETREHLAKIAIGRIHSIKTRAKMSAAHKALYLARRSKLAGVV